MKAKTQKRIVRNGFTLIEMMIVIGIIALLAALTLGISNSVLRNSEIRRTEDVLKLLSMAIQEWELEKGRSITFEGYIPIIGGAYDVMGYTVGEPIGVPLFNQSVDNDDMLDAMKSRMDQLFVVLSRSEPAKDILSKILSNNYADGEFGKLIVDAWQTPIGIVFPGRNFAEAYPLNDPDKQYLYEDESDDLTVRDQAEDGLGSCINLRPYFVSAGPDGLWGYRFQANDGPVGENITIWKASHDNIYSYEPFIVEEAR